MEFDGASAPREEEGEREGDGEPVAIETNGVRLHAVRAGPRSGPLAVLLHGFPEFWYGWRDQIRPLANAGYRVVVPDQRGYNLSDTPAGVGAYRIGELAADVAGLLDACDRDRAHLVGHDWGGGVAWWTALQHPERVATLTAVNAPHPSAFRNRLERSWRQRLRSWYTLLFQVPGAERLCRLRDWWPLVRTMRRSSLPGTFSAAEFDRYRAAWSRPGAFEAMLNWYRAAARWPESPDSGTVDAETLVVWGTDDDYLPVSLAFESADRCADARVATVDGATHWVQHEYSARVADLLVDQFGAGRRSAD